MGHHASSRMSTDCSGNSTQTLPFHQHSNAQDISRRAPQSPNDSALDAYEPALHPRASPPEGQAQQPPDRRTSALLLPVESASSATCQQECLAQDLGTVEDLSGCQTDEAGTRPIDTNSAEGAQRADTRGHAAVGSRCEESGEDGLPGPPQVGTPGWECNQQIEKDLHRTFPGHPVMDASGRNALRRLLTAYARRNSAVGYCQVHVTGWWACGKVKCVLILASRLTR